MAIIKQKRITNYTIVNNEILAPNNLSFEAMGVLCMLLSKPDDWEVYPAALVNYTVDTRKQSKRDTIYMIINELMSAGYIHREKQRNGQTEYHVYDEPNTELPFYGNRVIGKSRNTNIPTQVSKDINIINKDVITNTSSNDDASSAIKTKKVRSTKPKAPVTDIYDAYNEVLGDKLPKALILTDSRKREISARWNELLNTEHKGKLRYSGVEDGINWWNRLFAKVTLNPHWIGENDRGWRADLDWIINKKNFIKVLEYVPNNKK